MQIGLVNEESMVSKARNAPAVGVGIIVYKFIDGKLFVMLHRRINTSFAEGYWGSGGGHLKVGESLEAGALRELSEEAGPDIKVANLSCMGVVNFTDFRPLHYVDISFKAAWVSGEPVNCIPEKATDWQWFSLDSLPSPLLPPVKLYLETFYEGFVLRDASFGSN